MHNSLREREKRMLLHYVAFVHVLNKEGGVFK